MLWNTIPNEERLRLWKSLRDDLKDQTLLDQLKEVSKFCSKMPIGTRTIDYYTPANWPTPWEILVHGLFCTSSISLFMAYTIELVSPETKVELYLVDEGGDIYMLPVIEDHFILNYHLGSVNTLPEIEKEFQIVKIYKSEDIRKLT